MEAHPGALETHPGALEADSGAMEGSLWLSLLKYDNDQTNLAGCFIRLSGLISYVHVALRGFN